MTRTAWFRGESGSDARVASDRAREASIMAPLRVSREGRGLPEATTRVVCCHRFDDRARLVFQGRLRPAAAPTVEPGGRLSYKNRNLVAGGERGRSHRRG